MRYSYRNLSLEWMYRSYLRDGIGFYLCVLVVAIAASAAFQLFYIDHRQDEIDIRQSRLEWLLSSEEQLTSPEAELLVEERQEMATNLLRADEEFNLISKDNYPWLYSESRLEQLVEMSETGKPFELPEHTPTSWGALLSFWTQHSGLRIALIGLSLITFAFFMEKTVQRREQAANMPWRNGWPFAFLVLWFPFFPIAVIVTMIRGGGIVEYRPIVEQEQPARDPFDTPQIPRDASTVRRNTGYVPTKEQREIARTKYRDVLTGRKQRALEQRLPNLRERLEDHQDTAKIYSGYVAESRKEAKQLKQEIAELEESLEGDRAELDATQLEAEFDQILEMPGVKGAEWDDGAAALVVIVESTIKHRGSVYDGGDWMITISENGQFYTRNIRQSRPEAGQMYPSSHLGFCFNSRAEDIVQYSLKGQWAAAIALAIEAFNYVNEGDRTAIPEYFRKKRGISQLTNV